VTTVSRFGGLDIAWDERVLEPRAWTVAQSQWAADLLPELPPGPVLELGSGAGQIGLLAVWYVPRPLVCVDADPVACDYARQNAQVAGVGPLVDVRQGDLASALEPGERFALVLADPPWVRSEDVARFPEDPVVAIDGGEDGLGLVRACLREAVDRLLPGGTVLLQVGPGQPEAVAEEAEAVGLRSVEVRCHGDRGALVRLDPAWSPGEGGTPRHD
jgi:release factor glutamine methyltransferase